MIFQGRMIGFIPASDARKSRQFYEEVLGMLFVSDDNFALVMDANGTPIRIVRVGAFTPAPFTIMGWEVAGIGNVVQQMAAQGVTFKKYGFPGQDDSGVWTAPDGAKVAWIEDPDGNVLSLSEHL